MLYDFYHSDKYRETQSALTKENWVRGVFDFRFKREKRKCARQGCKKIFEVRLSDKTIYCSHSCAAKINNVRRGACPIEVKYKISQALKGRKNHHGGNRGGAKGMNLVPKTENICANPSCQKVFLSDRWMHRKFCSVKCSILFTGSKPTSPKASRGKGGIRKDIDKRIYFYSRWEANIGRLFNYLKIKWQFQPKTFDLGSQTYTPDFYLPEYDFYIEVKNFLWEYSRIRDEKFRKIYPNKILVLLLKEDYLEIELEYSKFIKNWEYKNSPFEALL